MLETARGGILLRGIGVLHNDVAVVTNVSADHLDLQGISTVDQLAEVKATVTRITRPDGWVVLNADDPRVLAMRRTASARLWLFSLDPRHPALREALAGRGRAITVVDGTIVWMQGAAVHPLVDLDRVPVTLAGLSRMYTQNALAAAAAGLAVGTAAEERVEGPPDLRAGSQEEPGAHQPLLPRPPAPGRSTTPTTKPGWMDSSEILQGLRPAGREIWLAIGTAGDRTDDILQGFAVRAALGADHLVIAELLKYLRGRPREDVVEQLRRERPAPACTTWRCIRTRCEPSGRC